MKHDFAKNCFFSADINTCAPLLRLSCKKTPFVCRELPALEKVDL